MPTYRFYNKNTKTEFEEMGYMLPEKKTAYPFWKDGAGEEE